MQGERASIGPLSEALNFEHGSTSSNGVINQPIIYWENNIHNIADNELQNYMIPSPDLNSTFSNSDYQGQQDLSSSGSNRSLQNVNLNAEYHPEGMNQVTDCPGLFFNNGVGGSSASGFEESSSNGGSSRKRKALDSSIDPSSSSRGCYRNFQHGESSNGTSLNLSGPSLPVQQEAVLRRRPVVPSDQHRLDMRYSHGYGHVARAAPVLRRLPAMSRNMLPPLQWTGPSTSVPPVYRNIALQQNVLESSLFVPPPQLHNRHATSGNLNMAPPPSGQPSPSNPMWAPSHQSHLPQYQRRLSELLRSSAMSPLAVNGLNPRASTNQTTHRPVVPADEVLLRSGGDNGSQTRDHHRSYMRAAPWLERQGDGAIGAPHSLRVFAAASRGRSRLVASEIRNVLDLMRRGNNLRFEDVMLLDQSVLLGMVDIHDRHRDMRLDVDNMSYEELLALEERMGDVCTGLNEETIMNRLKQRKYKNTCRFLQDAEPCCICQEEYKEGEHVATLECGHEFHSQCIKEWLKQKNLCPICKTTGLNTSDKPK